MSALQRAVQVAELPLGGPGAESAFPKYGSLSPRLCQHSLPCFSQTKKEDKTVSMVRYFSAAHLDYNKLKNVSHQQLCQESSDGGKTVEFGLCQGHISASLLTIKLPSLQFNSRKSIELRPLEYQYSFRDLMKFNSFNTTHLVS